MKSLMFTLFLVCLFVKSGSSQTPCSNCDFSAPCTMSMFDMPICANGFGDQDGRKPFPFKESVLSKRVDFIITQSLLSNMGISEILIDFGDGSGFFGPLPGGTSVEINYPTTGTKTINWITCAQDNSCDGEFTIDIKAPPIDYTPPDEIWNITTEETWTPVCPTAYTTAENAAYTNDEIGAANA